MPDPAVNDAQALRNELDEIHNNIGTLRNRRYQTNAWDTVTYGLKLAVLTGAVVAGGVLAYTGANGVYTWWNKPKPVAQLPTDDYFMVTGAVKTGPRTVRLVLANVDDQSALLNINAPVTKYDVGADSLDDTEWDVVLREAQTPGSSGTLTPEQTTIVAGINAYWNSDAPRGRATVELTGVQKPDDLLVVPAPSVGRRLARFPSDSRTSRVSISPPREASYFRVDSNGVEFLDLGPK